MKEEYLEMEGYEEYVSQMCEEEAVEENTSITQSQQEQHQVKPDQRPEEMFPIQPTDFDGHADDVMLRKLLKKFQMTFLYPFFKGK